MFLNRAACDNVARRLRKDGVGAEVKHAEVFTEKDKLKLWETGTIGTSGCTINITPHNFVVNLQPNVQSHE